jgi:hypothetical protein
VEKYFTLLQAAAVTVVACVLIVGSCADVFSVEPDGREIGDDAPLRYRSKFTGTLARVCRWAMVLVLAVLAAVYTPVFSTIMLTLTVLPAGIFTQDGLTKTFIILVSGTIVFVCWIGLLTTILRWRHMRGAQNKAPATPDGS